MAINLVAVDPFHEITDPALKKKKKNFFFVIFFQSKVYIMVFMYELIIYEYQTKKSDFLKKHSRNFG